MKAIHPVRALTAEEVRALQGYAKATSERADIVKRARALLAVRAGQAYTHAAHEAGYKSGDSVSQLVERFNQQGLAALRIARGRGRKVQYTVAQRERILHERQREPDRREDATATWSLELLERALRREVLPRVSASTIRAVLHEAGYYFGKSRTWCPTGTAVRKRAGRPATVQDPRAGEKSN
jgi:transposase